MNRNILLDALSNLGDSHDGNIIELARRYQILFTTPEGQLVLEDLKQRCFFYASTEDSSESDKQDRVNEGNRQVVLYILMMMGLDTASAIDSVTRGSES